MIDHTSTRIEQQETALRRQNRRRYAFQRMLEATDRVLWQLEEMNRDGGKTVPPGVRTGRAGAGGVIPHHAREALQDTGHREAPAGHPFEGQGRVVRVRY